MVSIIIPAKNEEKYLPKLFESLKEQTDQDFEIIVGDAQSEDGTRKIALDFGATVVEGGMPAVGRNRGAAASKGDIFLFLDADVILPANFLAKARAEFEAKKADFATTYMEPIGRGWFNKVSHSLGNFFYRFSITTPGFCIFARRDLFEKVGGFDESIKVLEDLKFGHDASKFGKYVVLHSVKIGVSDRRMHSEGWLVTVVRTTLMVSYVKIFGFTKKNLFNYEFKHYR